MGGIKIPSEYFEYIVMALEIMLILLTAAFTFLSLLWFGQTLAKDFIHISGSGEGFAVTKEAIVELLDITLLTLIIIDVLQIVVARYTSSYDYLRIAVEVGMLSLLRELISVEIKKPDPIKVLSFAIAILMLFFVWLGLNRARVVDALKESLLK
ncbi:phosphate-starvation-inducible PsiE family protein [Ignicoccus hospitalis]|nr:phosphate-starvation-inducible PsiE family protein [Ignicoccus hospitalis]